jgi:predicted oxidoreductase
MTRKNIFLLGFATALAVAYAVWFTDWFAPRTFTVFHTFRAARGRPAEPALTFVASRWLKLTELRVVPLAEWTTNKNAVPLWHLVSESNSIPLKHFTYGQSIAGLHPALKGLRPDFPQTNVTYRLIVTAGKDMAEHDFELK